MDMLDIVFYKCLYIMYVLLYLIRMCFVEICWFYKRKKVIMYIN